MTKCQPLHTPRMGQKWKCNQTPLLCKNRRTRNLSYGARRCEHGVTPSKFFQRDYSVRHERPPFILKFAVDRTRLSRDVLQTSTVISSKYLRKATIQRLHRQK